jgi:hypothetical protein
MTPANFALGIRFDAAWQKRPLKWAELPQIWKDRPRGTQLVADIGKATRLRYCLRE